MHKIDIINSRIVGIEELKRRVATWKLLSGKIVFTNGCFDILHRGHIEYLAAAADLGTKLIIGLNSDASVKKLKGENRPINSIDDRALALASLHFVDAVIEFEEDTPINLIQQLEPNVLAKGGDYSIDKIVGADIVTKLGGSIAIIDFTEGYSTTTFLDKLKA
jgi:D-glycero-beta-D-manno-heptose 1-phosphate adenylyltransferase